jgi:uncharacterized membrane protein YoaK (UPF0700 family)
MLQYGRNLRILAMGYATLAGAVDAIGFLKSGGLFVSFMSGNSTRLAIGVAESITVAAAAGALIALFVTGVILNVLVSESAPAGHRKVAATMSVAALLLAAAAADSAGHELLAIGCLCLAMGAANAIFRREGEVGIGVTYMTGTLVKLGHRLADVLRGARDRQWLSYFLLWLSLVIGGVAGARAFLWSPNASLWCAAVAAMFLSGQTWWLMRSAGRAER